ncbi:MFS transporter [Luteibacter yeojuensis]|uniref:MFS transporter n=1 Tax=Luteibacter yeojuensis TaxID=345309 RepID=A0A7X5QV53_9GAMM|nr:MFS transporter [Luteibacter yeojuensis]NID15999.1 MFS transporter [Luteibacter yeojuensis]
MDRRLLMLALGMFALGTDSFVVAGVLPELADHFHVGIGAAGQMTTAYALSYAILAPLIAALAAHVPRKRLLLGSLSIFVVANLLTAIAPTFWFAIAMRVLAGLGAAMFAPTATGTATMLVPAGRRGFALSVIIAGLTFATALGSPIGTVIGGLGDWRYTMVFVAALATVAALGVAMLLHDVPLPPQISLRERIAPLHDSRVALTLLTTLLGQTGNFIVYTYFAVIFDRVIGGSTAFLGVLLVLWGSAGTAMNLLAGRYIDRIGSRKVLLFMFTVLIADMALMPWASAWVTTGVVAIVVFGACAWGFQVPQQHRLVHLAPSSAPVVLGLNTAGTYFGVSTAGALGAAGLATVGAHHLGLLSSGFMALALVVAELAHRRIHALERRGSARADALACTS